MNGKLGTWARIRPVLLVAAMAALVSLIELGRFTGNVVPIPFLLLYAGVVASGGSGGRWAGGISGALAGAYVVYAAAVGFGPRTLTGDEIHATMGVVLYFGTGVLLGHVRTQRDQLHRAAQEHKDQLESEVLARTAELRRNQEALRTSEEMFRQMAENISEVFWMTDPEKAEMIYVSPAYETIWGRSRESLYESPLSFVDPVHPDDKERVVAALQKQTLGEYDETFRILRPDGGIRWIRDRAFPIENEAGSVYRVVGIADDITVLKEAEAAVVASESRLRGILKTAPEAIIVVGPDLIVRHFNREAERIFGYSAAEMIGQPLDPLIPADRREAHSSHVRAFENSADDYRLMSTRSEISGVRKDGSVFPAAASISKFGDGSERIFVVALQDISVRKQTEAQLRQAQKMEAVGQLTGGIAHDFNNLLGIIQGNAEVLARRETVDRSLSDAIIRAAGRGAELTQHLLAFSRRQPLNPRVVDLGALVSGMSQMLTRALGETIEIEIAAPQGLWTALVDPGQVENALLNLAINARDAMPNGGRLTIECQNAHLEEGDAIVCPDAETIVGDFVVLAVKDTGTGMPAEVRAQAFDPFYTTKEVGEGSGLGLSMVYGFVRQSGGYVTLDSEVGRGTAVKLYLPPTGDQPRIEKESRDGAVPRGGSETVLVVEDDSGMRTLAVLMLEELGYRAIAVPDATGARDAAAGSTQIDLLLSDVVLPGGVSGPQIAAEICTGNPDMKVIFMSGYSLEAAERGDLLDASKTLINKPFSLRRLAQAVRAELDQGAAV